MLENCVCCSGKPMSGCCGPLLGRQSIAKTPVQLMRSRYSAYALGGYGDYLLDTWLPSMTKGLTSAMLSASSIEWMRLDVLNKSQQGDNGQVEFNAFYLSNDGKEEVQHEKSVFRRVSGRWYYVGGEVGSEING